MDSRWFLVPQITFTVDGTSLNGPKYHDQVDHYSGQRYDVPSEWNLPVTGWHYMVRFYATTATLDSIASNNDAYTAADVGVSDSDVEMFLNRVVGRAQSLVEWEGEFWCEG